ncbi:centriolar coiled-coil protein of 110 kDa [Petromyzon marinus]|uniref:centriolar coiled-coil protein of 110 kDa n=1 Tax=Petromyzon marinus TaxID=7757 RepID=UPI003F6EDC74
MESYEEFVSQALARISFQAPYDPVERSPGERCLGEWRPTPTKSTVQFLGIPILPPLLSSESRHTMRNLRASALGVQRRRTRDQRSPRENVGRVFISAKENVKSQKSSHLNDVACAKYDERASHAEDRLHTHVDNEEKESPAKETLQQSHRKQNEDEHHDTSPAEIKLSLSHEESKDRRLKPTQDSATARSSNYNNSSRGNKVGSSNSNISSSTTANSQHSLRRPQTISFAKNWTCEPGRSNSEEGLPPNKRSVSRLSSSSSGSSSSYSCLPSPKMSGSPCPALASRPGKGKMLHGDRFSPLNCSYNVDEPSPVLLASRLREVAGDGESGRPSSCRSCSDAEVKRRLEFGGTALNGGNDGNGIGGGRWPVSQHSNGNARAPPTQTTPRSASGKVTCAATPPWKQESLSAWPHSQGGPTHSSARLEPPPTFRALLARAADSPGLRRAIEVVTAVGKGFLTRRLMRTEKLQHLKQTVLDTTQLLQSVQRESRMKNGILSSQDATLETRLNAQLRAALTEIHEIFHGAAGSVRARILHRDRELQKERRLRELEKGKGQLSKGPASQRPPLERSRQQTKPVVSRPTKPATANQQKVVRGRSGERRPNTGISRMRNFVY